MPVAHNSLGSHRMPHVSKRGKEASSATLPKYTAPTPSGSTPLATSNAQRNPQDYHAAVAVSSLTGSMAEVTIQDSVGAGQDGFQTVERKYGRGRTKSTVPAGNWNHHKQDNQGKRGTVMEQSFRSRAGTALTTATRLLRRKTKSGVAYSAQKAGVVVWHWDYRPLKAELPEDHPDRKFMGQGPDGSYWLKKGRWFLILAKAKYVVSEVPLYTHGGCGLDRKSEDMKWEYLSVKPLRIKDGEKFVNQSEDNPILEFASQSNPDATFPATMVAHFTEVRTRDVDCDELRMDAQLTYESTMIVVEKARAHLGTDSRTA